MTTVLMIRESHLPSLSTSPLLVEVRSCRNIYKLLIHFLSVVTRPVSVSIRTTPTTILTSEDPLDFLSPEEREFIELLPPAEREIILASLTSPRPVTESEDQEEPEEQEVETEEQEKDPGDTALETLNSLAQELQNLNFSIGNTEIGIPSPAPRISENSGDSESGSEEDSENTSRSETTYATPAFTIVSPTLHNSSSVIR